MPDAPFALEAPAVGAALLSDCGRYRYWLTRSWGPGINACCFVMLNPSTADASKSDPTMKRCLDFARSWGHDSLAIVNLFALRATDPRELKGAADPVGPDADRHLLHWACQATRVVCAWGAKGGHLDRDRVVLAGLRKFCRPQCLRLTKGGHPEHPLYLPADLEPFDLPDDTPKHGAPLREFGRNEVREAVRYALDGGQALHLHRIIPDRAKAPAAFLAAHDRGELIAHLFDQDAERLARTVRGFGVRRVAIERPGTAKQHHDLCGGPLRRAMELAITEDSPRA